MGVSMKKRGVLSLWKVILLVIAGLIGIVGVGVLGVYLTNGFGEKTVEPDDISFVQDISDGQGYFNSSKNRLDVSSDFKLTITATPDNVTKKAVELELAGGRDLGNGYITDDIVTAPKWVNINSPFEIKLNKEYNTQLGYDHIVGGVSVLTARSVNEIAVPKSITINVDVPVDSLSVSVKGTNQTGEVQDVVIGTNFSFDITYLPDESRYMFSDKENEKEIFYSFVAGDYINYNWETKQFETLKKTGNSSVPIMVYTFANSYYQNLVMSSHSGLTGEELTNAVLRDFRDHPEYCVFTTVNIRVLDIDVETITIENEGQRFNTYLDQYFLLTANSNNGNAKLAVSILDSKGADLSSLNGNLGIKIPKGTNGLSIVGGNVMKVVSEADGSTTISQEKYDSQMDYSAAPEGVEYYVLANSVPQNYDDYYWQFTAEQEGDFSLAVNFFFEDENGEWDTFFEMSGAANLEKYISLLAETHDDEREPAWVNNDTLTMTINYDEDGTVIPASEPLYSHLTDTISGNVYQTIKYFLLVDASDPVSATLDLQEIFSCERGVAYSTDYLGQPLNIQNATSTDGGYILYEIEGNVLTAIKSFSGRAKIVVATIKTKADTTPYYEENGSYMLVKVSRAKDVVVESSLSIANMEATVSIDTSIVPNAEHNNDYYIPAINRNESGSQKTMLTFNLTLNNSEDTVSDSQKVINAFSSKNLEIYCLDFSGQKTNQYITLQGLTQKNVDGTSINFEGALLIEEAFFAAGRNSLDDGTYIRLQLQYNDGTEVYSKDVSINGDEEGKNYFYIYFQQPVQMEAAYSRVQDINVDDDIEVNISADDISIMWGAKELVGNSSSEVINALNDLLTFTLTDQFGNVIQPNTNIYKIRFEETTTDNIADKVISLSGTLDKIQNFSSTNGKLRSTSLKAYIVDREDEYVKIYDENGTMTDNLMCSQTLNFKIQSEGVQSLRYDSSTSIEEPNMQESASLSEVEIRKYVTSGSQIDLPGLVEISTSSGQLGTDEIVFKLDESFINGLSTNNRTDIMNMIEFNVEEATGNADTTSTNIIDFRGVEISNVRVINPFGEDTEVVFSITDVNEALFNITLRLWFLSDITVKQNFETYYQQNKDYLTTSGNAISVFADEEYALEDYITFSSHLGETYNFDYLNALSLVSSVDGIYYESSGLCTLEKVNDKYVFRIKQTYQFRQITIVLYYGINSYYSCRFNVTLYINPNIVVRKNVSTIGANPFVNMNNLSNIEVGSTYQIYKFTDYIKNQSFDGAQEYTGVEGFSFNNLSVNKYVNIGLNENNAFVFEFENGISLNLTLGQKFEQVYSLLAVAGDGATQRVDAAIIIDDGTNKEIVLCQTGQSMTVSLDIGFGEDGDPFSMASQILRKVVAIAPEEKTENVNVVIYNGVANLLLTTQTTYKTQADYSIISNSVTGYLSVAGADLRTKTDMGGLVSLVGNSFKVGRNITDSKGNSITINVSLNAIISKLGDKFVYYNNGTVDLSDMQFNYFDEETQFSTLIGDYTGLGDVYQSLQAGKTYTIVHDSQEEITDSSDVYGFYFDFEKTGLGETSEFTLSIVSGTEGYLEGLARVVADENGRLTKLQIGNLESSYTDAYIVVKLEVRGYSEGTFVWYYRIKVSPSFTVGSVNYPYQVSGEYLDEFSQYYDEKTSTYTIDLEEEFTAQNSANKQGKRFGEIEWLNENSGSNITSHYYIQSAQLILDTGAINIDSVMFDRYFSYQFDTQGVLTISPVDVSSKLSIVVVKSFMADGADMIGSEMKYNLYFNQGDTYLSTVKKTVDTIQTQLTPSTQYTYNDTIEAGSGEVVYDVNIRISSNGTESTVNNFWAYIKGQNIEQFLQAKAYLEKGTKYYESSTSSESTGVLENDVVFGEWDEEIPTSGKVEVNVGDGVVYVDATDVQKRYAYLENSALHLKPKDTIEEDNVFEIGFYTEQKIAFKIYLTITSYFKWELNDSFVGGETYSLNAEENGLFSVLNSENADWVITDITMELMNDTAIGDNLNLSDLYKIQGNSLANKTIEFAHLTEDQTFEFKATVEATNPADLTTTSYSFDFELLVGRSFNLQQNRRADDPTSRYGQIGFDVSIENLKGLVVGGLPVVENSSEYQFTNNTTTMEITPNDVGKSTSVQTLLNLVYIFNGKDIFEFDVEYRYTTLPNVVVKSNYPSPDGESALNTEYISSTKVGETFTSDTIENFFTSPAMFGSQNRITVEQVAEITDSQVEKIWSISVGSITNAEVVVSNSTTITPSSSNKTIISNGDEVGVSNISLKFNLLNSSSVGTVVFNVVINNVSTIYNVTIVPSSNITISTNTPNYVGNQETIYAEDITKMTEQTIFAQNRILSYQFADGQIAGTTYYLRFKNQLTGDIQFKEITVSEGSGVVNVDLGRSYLNYQFENVFESLRNAETETNPLSGVFKTEPTLTSRIKAYYYDGTPILFNEKVKLMLTSSETGKENAETYALSLSNLGKTETLSVSVEVGNKTISTTGVYNIYLDLEFEVVGNADDADSYTVVEIEAGETTKLLSETAFGIRNKRTGELYTEDSISKSSGKIELKIYGFKDVLQIEPSSTDALTNTAYLIHKKLTESTDQIVYKTGLNPQAGVALNEAVSANFDRNYLTIAGVTSSNDDYTITAKGASNDGNHVMMRLIYTVVLGGEQLTAEHNIMFKVLPNSSISFRVQQNTTDYLNNEEATQIVDNQTVASNYVSPYSILWSTLTGSNVSFNIWNNSDVLDLTASTILANMYGSTSNSANEFKYTYIPNKMEGYNDSSITVWGTVVSPDETEAKVYNATFEAGENNVTVSLNKIELGTRSFVIEMENKYGYKINFYFTMTADIDPFLYNAPTRLIEGTTIGVGLRYQTVSIPTVNVQQGLSTLSYVVFDSFRGDDLTEGNSNIVISLNNISDNYKINGARLVATDNSNNKYYKNWGESTFSGTEITLTIFDEDVAWLDQDSRSEYLNIETLKGCSFELQLSVSRITQKEEDPDFVNTEPIGSYVAKLSFDNDKELTQVHSESSGYMDPNFGSDPPVNQIVLSGIDAFGYANTIGAVNSPDIKNSLMNNILVKSVDFYLGETWLGGTYLSKEGQIVSTSTKEQYDVNNSTSTNLITNENYSFAQGTEIIRGTSFNADVAYVVPAISGIYYGTGTTLENVRMAITLVSGTESCVLSQYITLQRESDGELFETTVYDTYSPQQKAISGEILNDTLEVILNPGDEITLLINDQQITGYDENSNTIMTDYGSKTANRVVLSNEKSYITTEYVGISSKITNLSYNLQKDSDFYIYILSKTGTPELVYNGTTLDSTIMTNIASVIEQYNTAEALVQHISSVDEVSSKRWLYFLWSNIEVGQTYQQAIEFTILPLYNSATAGSLISVNDYYTMSNGAKHYYIIPYNVWSSGITLSGSQQNIRMNSEDAYKFYFEISKGSDGGSAGSAFIDENGTITTSENFEIAYHTLTVNVYMKVSGANGMFEEVNTETSLFLGAFTINLGTTMAGTVEQTAGVYNIDGQLIVVPDGWSLTYSGTKNTIGEGADDTLQAEEYSIGVGEVVEFERWFNGLTGNFQHNVNYHIVISKLGSEENYIYYDNINSYIFNQAGEYEITVVVSGRDNIESEIGFKKIIFTLIVYETSTMENEQLSGQLISGNASFKFNESYTWYVLKDNNIVENVKGATFTEIGAYTNRYLAVNELGNSKYVVKTFYVYDNIVSKNIVLRPTSTYRPGNLVDLQEGESVEVYKISSENSVEDLTSKADEFYSVPTNSTEEREYIMVKKDINGDIISVEKYVITFIVAAENIYDESMFFGTNEPLQDEISLKIKERLSLSEEDSITIYEILDNNVLEEVSSQTVIGEAVSNMVSKKYLVQYVSNGKTTYRRFAFTYYVYQEKFDEDRAISYSTPSTNAFLLSNLNQSVANAIGDLQASDIYGYYQLSSSGEIQQTTIIVLDEGGRTYNQTYYVNTKSGYYLITVNITTT